MHFQKFSVALLLLLGMAFTGRAETPNVLFLAVDDMNDWLGCLETTPRAITPNIDQLAARGVNFTNAHTAGVFCAPSRAAIFSGQFGRPLISTIIRKSNHCNSASQKQVMKLSVRESCFIIPPAQSINEDGPSSFSAIKVSGKAAGH